MISKYFGGALVATLGVVGCADKHVRPSEVGCDFVRIEGHCEVTLTLEPREAESPDEAANLVVRWEWLKPDVAGPVPDRSTTYHLTWREAASRAATIDRDDKSRCIVEEGRGNARCETIRAIIFVEAEP